MKIIHCILFTLTSLFAHLCPAAAETAKPLDTAAATKSLGTRIRNPVKSISPVVKRTYGRDPVKGIEVETLTREDGTQEERPYVAVPLLFVRGKDELLDAVSRDNAAKLAEVLRGVLAQDAAARFTIQGHTSAEGGRDANERLSQQRAARIFQLLLSAGIPQDRLAHVGFGPQFATTPADGPEPARQQDRRVLVIRN